MSFARIAFYVDMQFAAVFVIHITTRVLTSKKYYLCILNVDVFFIKKNH